MVRSRHAPADHHAFAARRRPAQLRSRMLGWAIFPRTVENFLQLPPERMLSIGYAKEENPVNKMKTERAPLVEVADFIDV